MSEREVVKANERRGSNRVVVEVANSRAERTGERKKTDGRKREKRKKYNRDKYHTRVGEKGKKEKQLE